MKLQTTDSNLISRKEVAQILGVTEQTVSNLVQRGLFTTTQIDDVPNSKRKMYFYRNEVEALSQASASEIEQSIARLKEYKQKLTDQQTELEEMYKSNQKVFDKDLYQYNMITNRMMFSFIKRMMKTDTTITPTEATIFKYIENGYNLVEIAKELNVSRERIRQLYCRMMNKLNKFIDNCFLVEDRNKQLAEECRQMRYKLNMLIEKGEAEAQRKLDEFKPLYSKSVEDLNLPVRCLSVFQTMDIKTVGDLIKYTPSQILNKRNMGKKTLYVLLETLEKHGIQLAAE